MVPLIVVEQLVDVIVGSDEVDVLLVVEGGLIAVDAAAFAWQQRGEGAGGLLVRPLGLDEEVSHPDGLAIADVADFVAGVGVEPGVEGGVGDGFAQFVGADFGESVEEGAGKDTAVAVGEGNDGVVDVCAEGVMVAAELAAGGAQCAWAVTYNVGREVDEVQGVRCGGGQRVACDPALDLRLNLGVGDEASGGCWGSGLAAGNVD